MSWRRLNGELLQGDIRDLVRQTIDAENKAGNKIKICVGTDSQQRADCIGFATVIVFLREKKGGFMYIKSAKYFQTVGLRERMIYEVSKSVEVAYQLCDILDELGVDLEVHADINTDPGFKSNSALKEAMGYIMGMGFVFKAKPDAFASSSCADKVV